MKNTLCFLLTLLLTSCNNSPQVTEISPVLDETKMVQLLADIHIAEAGFKVPQLKKNKTIPIEIIDMYNYIFATQNVSQSDFETTFDYYLHHPQEMQDLYKKIALELTEREKKLKE